MEMAYFEVRKAIYLNSEVLGQLESALRYLEGIDIELDALAAEDDNYTLMRDEAGMARASLASFLDAYAERDR